MKQNKTKQRAIAAQGYGIANVAAVTGSCYGTTYYRVYPVADLVATGKPPRRYERQSPTGARYFGSITDAQLRDYEPFVHFSQLKYYDINKGE